MVFICKGMMAEHAIFYLQPIDFQSICRQSNPPPPCAATIHFTKGIIDSIINRRVVSALRKLLGTGCVKEK